MSKVIASWSGGKDSCLACATALSQGHDISCLVNFISHDYQRVRFHGTEARLIQLQAEAIGIPLLQKQTTPDGYEDQFKEAVSSLIPDGVEGMVFGDIYLQEHKDWTERVCADVGIGAIEPLWGRETEEVLVEFIESGFEATVISARCDRFDAEWLGRRVDQSFLSYLRANQIDACGEHGEYHTFVTGGPIFSTEIRITSSRPVSRDGYWLLDTLAYSR